MRQSKSFVSGTFSNVDDDQEHKGCYSCWHNRDGKMVVDGGLVGDGRLVHDGRLAWVGKLLGGEHVRSS